MFRRAEVDLVVLAALGVVRGEVAPVHFDPDATTLSLLGDDRRLLQLLRILRELRLSPEELLPAPLFIERHDSHVRLQRRLACLPDFLEDPARLLETPLPAVLGQGLGLQLPLAAAIASEHGGRMRVEAEGGSRVSLVAELPMLA